MILSKIVRCFCPYTEPRKQLRTDFYTKDDHPRSYRPLHKEAEILVKGDKITRIREKTEVKYADVILCCFPGNLWCSVQPRQILVHIETASKHLQRQNNISF